MQLFNMFPKKLQGFTLIELLLSLSIAAVILLAVSVFLSLLLQARIKSQAIAEVEEQGTHILSRVTQAVRNAQAIISPAPGGSSSALTLDMMQASQDPTVFNTSGGVILMNEAGSSFIPLVNSRISVSSAAFQNLSRPGTPGTIRIKLILSHVNPEGRNEYSYTKTFYGSASVR